MSRKVVSLGYLIPNDGVSIEDFKKAITNVGYFGRSEIKCINRKGCTYTQLSDDLILAKIDLDTAFVTPRRFHEEIGYMRSRATVVFRVNFKVEEDGRDTLKTGERTPLYSNSPEVVHIKRGISLPFEVASGHGIDMI